MTARYGALVVLGAVACGPGLRRPDAREVARDVLVQSAGDPARIRALLRDTVTSGGLVFDDATCAARFSVGEVRSDQLDPFARCLAGLRWQASARTDALGDVVVLTYGAGFEIEARIIRAAHGPQLTWIGFASRSSDGDRAPTLGAAAFDALRVRGRATDSLAPEVARAVTAELDAGDPDDVALAWLKVCLDEAGAITSVEPFETTSYPAQEAFVAQARGWAFRPFVHRGRPRPVCSMVRMAHPPHKAPAHETLPLPPPPSRSARPPLVLSQRGFHKLQEGRRIAGTTRIEPDDPTKVRMKQSGVRRLTGRFRLCLDETGRVESVLPFESTGVAEYDRDLIAGMSQWVYAPYLIDGEPVPVCTQITFIYTQR